MLKCNKVLTYKNKIKKNKGGKIKWKRKKKGWYY